MRYLSIIGAIFLAVVLGGCEEGEAIDIDPGTPEDINLVVTSPDPGTAGLTVSVRATVTVDGNPVAGISVTFSATNGSQQNRPPSLSPVQTSILGFADTDFATLRADRQLIIDAIVGSTSSNTVTLELVPDS